MIKKYTLLVAAIFLICACQHTKRPLHIALITDTHLAEGAPCIATFSKIVDDVNQNDSIDFVILSGDITEFGSDRELQLADSLISRFQKPYYILAGNHDAKWSESGCNTFKEIFGYEQFAFEKNGIMFIGTNSGPNMRMAPALVPKESVLWMDSLLNATPAKTPIIFINHYPMMEGDVSNWSEIMQLLKTRNIQITICGHYHVDDTFSADGIPSVKCRSALADKLGPGYNIITIDPSTISFADRIVTADSAYTQSPWHQQPFPATEVYRTDTIYPTPSFAANREYPFITEEWTYNDVSDIGCAAVLSPAADRVVFANTQGVVKALDITDGQLVWQTPTNGKVFSTPAVTESCVYIASTDKNIYCLSLEDGHIIWSHNTPKGIVASPTVWDGKVYIGASDGIFRALDATTGELVWQNDCVKGFMEAKPYVDAQQVVIGSWGNQLYSFDPQDGHLQWTWDVPGMSRMYSPAATWPVKAHGKIFFTTPRRRGYALDAATGKVIWEVSGGRESIGLSIDGNHVFIKTMFDSLFSYQTQPQKAVADWKVKGGFDYEIAPSPVAATKELVLVPTCNGFIHAYDVKGGETKWVHRLSVALINSVIPVDENNYIVSAFDGKVSLLKQDSSKNPGQQ